MCRIIAHTHNLGHEFDDLFSTFIVKLLGATDGKPGVLKRYNGQVTLKTYLSVVFHHIVIDHHRERQREHLHCHGSEDIDAYADTAPSNTTQDPLDDPAVDTALDHALKSLPPNEYRLVEFYYFQKLKLRQIAGIMGCSISKISRQLEAVHRKLHGLLHHAVEDQ
jgi:RNA polymerase sigma factor (sigma-70 family)